MCSDSQNHSHLASGRFICQKSQDAEFNIIQFMEERSEGGKERGGKQRRKKKGGRRVENGALFLVSV